MNRPSADAIILSLFIPSTISKEKPMIKFMLSAAFLALAFISNPATAEETKLVRSISISGHGEVRAVPDVAMISIGVTTQAASAREALDGNTKAMKALLDTLKTAGIEARDIATSNFSVGPRLDYGNNNSQPPKVTGYDVNNMVTVTVRKIDDLGGMLDVAVSTGSNTINGISFSVSRPTAMMDSARKLAVADAKRKAELYAVAGGFRLGSIISVNEGATFPPPMPYQAKFSRSEAAADVPIAQGEQALSVDVSMTYEIK
jgi:uncharacterized protein